MNPSPQMPLSVVASRHSPKGLGSKSVTDVKACPPGFELARRHGLDLDKQVVQAPGAGKAGVISGVEHTVRAAEQLLGMLQG